MIMQLVNYILNNMVLFTLIGVELALILTSRSRYTKTLISNPFTDALPELEKQTNILYWLIVLQFIYQLPVGLFNESWSLSTNLGWFISVFINPVFIYYYEKIYFNFKFKRIPTIISIVLAPINFVLQLPFFIFPEFTGTILYNTLYTITFICSTMIVVLFAGTLIYQVLQKRINKKFGIYGTLNFIFISVFSISIYYILHVILPGPENIDKFIEIQTIFNYFAEFVQLILMLMTLKYFIQGKLDLHD